MILKKLDFIPSITTILYWIDWNWLWNIYRYFFDRYDIVKCKNIKRTEYRDIDYRMTSACFSLLEDYMKNESSIIDWTYDKYHKDAYLQMVELLHYWKNVFPNEDNNNPLYSDDIKSPDIKYQNENDELVQVLFQHKNKEDEIKWSKACDNSVIYEEMCREREKRNLKRLIDIMDFLWS